AYGYDRRGRRTSMTDALTNTTNWTFDKDSRMTSMVDANGADHTTAYHYDSIGRLKEVVYPDTQSEQRTYNGDGTVDTATDQNGTISLFTYDPDDQPNKITYQLHGGAAGMTQETFGYDVLGRLIAATSNAGIGGTTRTTSRTYDSLDRVLSETQDGRTMTREFDLVGNPTKTTYPGSSRIFQRSYDALDRLQQVNEWLDPAGKTLRSVRGYEYVGPNRI